MKNIIIISAVAAVFMACLGGGFYVLWGKIASIEQNVRAETTGENGEVEEVDEGPKPIFSLSTMIVNLADKGGRRYLRATMDLQLSQAGDEQKMESYLPQIKDATIKVMSTRRFEDISSIDGKNALRDEIIARLNEVTKAESITNIYFTEFVVQ